MWKIHWASMKRIIELGYQDEVSIRYNSNMSKINYFGLNSHWNILASIDGAYEVGEYIRTGLNFKEWYSNMQYGRKFVKYRKQLRMDLTITLPGMVGLKELLDIAEELDVDLLAKRVFGFSASNVWSPMCLPRKLLNDIVDEFIDANKNRLTNHIYFYTALKDLKEKQMLEDFDVTDRTENAKGGLAGIINL